MVRRGQPGKISDRASAELACYDSCLNIRNDFREEVWQPGSGGHGALSGNESRGRCAATKLAEQNLHRMTETAVLMDGGFCFVHEFLMEPKGENHELELQQIP